MHLDESFVKLWGVSGVSGLSTSDILTQVTQLGFIPSQFASLRQIPEATLWLFYEDSVIVLH